MTEPAGPAPGWVLGIDVGGTKTALGLVAFPEARIGDRQVIDTPAGTESGAPFLARVAEAAAELVDRAAASGRRTRAIGLSICELVDLAGHVTSRHRVHWAGLAVEERLGQIAPAVIQSDVRAAALAEARWGAGRGHGEFLYLNIGTGISTCWVKDGVPHAGARGNALALASSPISFTCPHCGTAGSYVLEDVAGGAGLTTLHARRSGKEAMSARQVLSAAAAGDRDAAAVIDEATRALGVSLGLAINVLDPEAVVVGGGLGVAGGPYWDGLVRATREHIWAASTRELPIRPAALGGDSALIGAAAQAWLTPPGK